MKEINGNNAMKSNDTLLYNITRRKRRTKTFSISRFYCPDCGSIMTVPRIRIREKFHKKDLWCTNCKKVKTMTEFRSFDFYKNMLGEKII